MSMIKNIAFTIYAVSDMAKARAFYEGVFGITPSDAFGGGKDPNASWIEYDIADGTFALGCSPDMWKPSADGASIAFEVEDFDAVIAKLKEVGAKFKIEPQDFPGCRMAAAHDPDGNVFAVHKLKPKTE